MIARADITGLVLSGGRGQRFEGRDKGWIEFEHRPLIEHACERLRPQVATLLISANRHVERYAALAPVVRDTSGADGRADADGGTNAYDGPLAGIVAALAVVRTGWLAVVPCDAPSFPLDLVERLAVRVGTARAACAQANGRLQPLFCLLHRSTRDDIASALARGERRATECLQALGAVPVGFADDAAFANLNTPGELARAGLAPARGRNDQAVR